MQQPVIEEPVNVEIIDGVAVLTLNRPNRNNAIDEEMLSSLEQATLALNDAEMRVVLIRASGSRFSVGGDLDYLSSYGERVGDVIVRMSEKFHDCLARLFHLDAPIVLAAQGAVAGGALGFLGVADIVIAAEGTRFAVGSAKVGLSPDGGVSWVLPHLIGLRRTAEMLLEHRVVSAREAEEWGLITRTVPGDELDDAGMTAARRLSAASLAPASREIRRLTHQALASGWEQQLGLELSSIQRSASAFERSIGARRSTARHAVEDPTET